MAKTVTLKVIYSNVEDETNYTQCVNEIQNVLDERIGNCSVTFVNEDLVE